MILTLQLGQDQVATGCPDGSLIFNGTEWVAPKVGDYAVLSGDKSSTSEALAYPVNVQDALGGFVNKWAYRCLILAVSPGSTPAGVLNLPDPLAGQNICLACRTGTQILNVQVTQI
jgi:hypothetical protein